ncbi:hypothetical protein [Streptomyces sp. TP-A0874]|uniref:hypothetical protein n=1 Tax=Streptomyces sp. TP-A0874 TaxID=549819 RepID=UPI00099FEA0F|nr:hypothetical protein [Streptomyces sp. TP-A0874]
MLVFPDREAAEAAAEEAVQRFALPEEPELVRETLAGEDDAEDAQWLLVLDDPAGQWTPERLDGFAAEYEGWWEAG